MQKPAEISTTRPVFAAIVVTTTPRANQPATQKQAASTDGPTPNQPVAHKRVTPATNRDTWATSTDIAERLNLTEGQTPNQPVAHKRVNLATSRDTCTVATTIIGRHTATSGLKGNQ